MRIFVLEDDQWYAEFLKHTIELNPENEVTIFNSGRELQKSLHKKPDVVCLDFGIPDIKGDVILKQIKTDFESIDVVVVSGQEDVATAIDLIKKGAFDYIVKDDDTSNRIWQTLIHVKEKRELKTTIENLSEEVSAKYDYSNVIKGSSAELKQVFAKLDKAKKTNITVSITGETGTGKELVAKAIHFNSDRKKKPYIPVNIAAIPSELIESELFGHEKGSFTGAHDRRIGKFEQANNGTIFLDEIGEMDVNLQAKLLRVLQEKELTRVGGGKPIKLDVRVICATHRSLVDEVSKGNFRQDLYYRLLGLPIELPPLRHRGEDIIILGEYFLDEFCKENKLGKKKFSLTAKNKMLKYRFPGNVRELKAVVELSAVLSDGDVIEEEHITFPVENDLGNSLDQDLTLREYTHKIIIHKMKKYNDNVIQVAKSLDVGKSTIYRILKDEIN